MSALARIMLDRKCAVTGSDLSLNYVTEGLEKKGAKIFLGHSASNITPDTTVVYSTDIKQENPEYQSALAQNCRMLHRSDFLASLMNGYKGLAVTGTHGKTTTSALLTTVLVEAGMHPSYAIGGILPQLQANAGAGSGEYFVAEADESDGTFLKYSPYGAIVTNIDLDHMNHFGTEEKLEAAFETFMEKVSAKLFWCGDDPRLQKMHPHGVSYGFTEGNQLAISNFKQEGWSCFFDIAFQGKSFKNIQVGLVGKHNALNAAAVFGLAYSLDVPESAIRTALKSFGGVLRRCEKKGAINGILFLDDYAHHPTEIKATLKGIRLAVEEKRLIAVYQPHRYTRIRDCLGTFSDVFEDADEVIITDIFGAGENPIPGVTSEALLEEIKNSTNALCKYVTHDALVDYLVDTLRPHDVVVSMGAGNITRLGSDILENFKSKHPKKLKVGLVFGGRSSEHEVSIRSANYVAEMLNPDYYDVSYFGITKQGTWIEGPEGLKQMALIAAESCETISHDVLEKILACDVIFPVLHGPFGEDGTIQGFFEILGKAYVGCGHASAAIAMDKAFTKNLALQQGIATLPFIAFTAHEWKENKESILQQIESRFVYPLFVKPVHLGSSVGISKVTGSQLLTDAIHFALRHDSKILIEQGIDAREIEFSVLGNGRVRVFPPGEICASGEVYTYDSKYGPQSAKTTARSDLPQHLIEEGMGLAKAAYQAAGCCGMSRVDFFLDKDQKFWLNEINPIPGFTSISLFPKMCEVNGLSGQELINRLIVLAMESKRRKRCIENVS